MEKLADRNFMQFNNGECNALHLGKNNLSHQYTLWTDRLERGSWKLLRDIRLTMRQQCVPATKVVNSLLGCIKKSITRRSRKVIFSLSSAL